ncbi:MAG: ComEC/Rec2 family competence protein [Campylobacterota bacterium]|nr:ComEC/Rec2 family competence protein [Campylobacterota bacterium]
MLLKEVELFSSKKDLFQFFLLLLFIFSYSLLIEYNNYKQLIQFDSALIDATVIKQYPKTKLTKTGKTKHYQVLKLKTSSSTIFYTTQSKKLQDIKGKKITLELWFKEISFYQYMTTFFGYSHIIDIEKTESFKQKLNHFIEKSHTNKDITYIYQALYTATPLTKELQTTFSSLGVSHLLAISGFHLGVLSTLLFFLIKYPYKFLQNRYFPYRNSTMDIFIIVAVVELLYLLFLDSPASLLRAFTMLIIGFVLYDRGLKIISMQTLSLTILIILTFAPRLFFSLGFWLSVAGVFYIFLFLIHFKQLHKVWQFILVPLWVYLMMLPLSLYLFGSFSLYHPLSILWTSLFTLFYPLSIFLHLFGFATLLDSSLIWLLHLHKESINIVLDFYLLVGFLGVSLIGVFYKRAIWVLILYSSFIFTYALFNLY